MRNQVDNAKNDLAKAKADWEREKKKQTNDHQTEIEQLKRELEEKEDTEIKA